MFPDQLSNYDNFAMRIKLMELEDPTSYTQRSEAETKTRFFTATHDNIDQVFEGHFLDDFLESVSDSSMQPVSKTCIDTSSYTSTANGANNIQLGEPAEIPRTTTPQLPYTRTQSVGQIDPNQWTTEELQHTVRRVKSLPTYRPKFGDEHNDEKFINRYLIDPGFMLQI